MAPRRPSPPGVVPSLDPVAQDDSPLMPTTGPYPDDESNALYSAGLRASKDGRLLGAFHRGYLDAVAGRYDSEAEAMIDLAVIVLTEEPRPSPLPD